MALDRTLAPSLTLIDSIKIHEAERLQLNNGIPVLSWNLGEQPVLMIRFLFEAGRWFEPKKMVAALCSRMLKEGTKSYHAKALVDKIEFYGSTLKTQSSSHFAEVTLYTLGKHLTDLLPLVKEVIREASFPIDNLELVKRNALEKLQIQEEKADFIADRKFMALLYGEDHPYGYSSKKESYDLVNVEDLKNFYSERYHPANCTIYLAGQLSNDTFDLVNAEFGTGDWGKVQKHTEPSFDIPDFSPGLHYISKEGSVQAAIKMGMPLFNKTHTDYCKFFVLNTLLGGFFGSRLSANIREEKGYTYGIYSSAASMMKSGYWQLSTEVRADIWQDALKEIFYEIDRLKSELIEDEELDLVRNYLLGTIMSGVDGPFQLASSLQGIFVYGLEESFYHKLIDTIKTVQPKELQELAQRYFINDNIAQVVVGP